MMIIGDYWYGPQSTLNRSCSSTHAVASTAVARAAPKILPAKPVAYDYGLLSIQYGLLSGMVAYHFRLLGFPKRPYYPVTHSTRPYFEDPVRWVGTKWVPLSEASLNLM